MQKIDDINNLIKRYNLQPHIEGGYFCRHYESNEYIKRESNEICKAGSAIYYMLTENDISHFHSIASDELWHFYDGGLLEIHIITKNNEYQVKYLGNSLRYNYASFCIPIEKGCIFAAKVVTGNYVFTGCSLHPEFEMDKFKLYSMEDLVKIYPQYTENITNFFKKYNGMK